MYIGRFAPSPTGPLHFGSLIAAVGSYLESRVHGGRWLIRIDDLDPPREQAGATDNILRTLERLGFKWDGEIMYQSHRYRAYESALEQLHLNGLLYRCKCSRRRVAKTGEKGQYGIVYPGTCRDRKVQDTHTALRVRTHNRRISVPDLIQGEYAQCLESDIGDFVLKRRDGYYAYHLAVVIDDAELGITNIVRGADLIDSTPRQVYIQQLLALPTPEYAHLPIAVNRDGQKLSKQSYARAINPEHSSTLLWKALEFLGQDPPESLKNESMSNIWSWAHLNWRLKNVPKFNDTFYMS